MKIITDRNRITDFIFGGKSIFTIKSNKTEKYFTFKSTTSKTSDTYFISMLVDNEYVFIGTIFNRNNFSYSQKSPLSSDYIGVRSFKWFFKVIMVKCINLQLIPY